MRPAPYMVALSGWPDPVFVAEARETWEKRHSRPPSPTGMQVRDGISLHSLSLHSAASVSSSLAGQPPLAREFRDGVPNYPRTSIMTSMVRTGSTGERQERSHPASRPASPRRASASPDAPSPPASHPNLRTHSRTHSHSSTTPRSGPGNLAAGPGSGSSGVSVSHMTMTPLPLTPLTTPGSTPTGSSAGGSAANASAAAMRGQQRRVHGFPDPRYGVNARVVGGARAPLRVAPTWTSSAPNHHSHGMQPYPSAQRSTAHVQVTHPYVGNRTHRTTGAPNIQHSVPEVWPPPKAGPGLATQVYPRDPDSPWMWGSGNTSTSASAAHSRGASVSRSISGSGSVSGSASPMSRASVSRGSSPRVHRERERERERETQRETQREMTPVHEEVHERDLKLEREREPTPTRMDVDA